jgi:hypothetical protein
LAHGLLGLGEAVAVTALAPRAEVPTALLDAYAATQHRYSGPFTVPALCDRRSGRIVSNHVPDILLRRRRPAARHPPRRHGLSAALGAVRAPLRGPASG